MKLTRLFSKYINILMISALFFTHATIVSASLQDGPFPMYPSIESNVAFWKKIYGTYTTSQGIIHDRRNLDIIYEVISLRDPHETGAIRMNYRQVKQVKNYYKKILKTLSTGKAPKLYEAKRVYALFVDHDALKILKDAHLHIRFQLGQKDRFRAGIIRSGAYIDEIKDIFQKHGLPQDLAYLPHVESSFNYKAYSKFGAAGIWQFTRSTGRRYMTINYTVDERRDPILATQAAARFLKKNFEALGNWPMAITAYNHGTNGMLRAQKSKGDYEMVFNGYNGRTFGFASRNFYSEFLAAREITKDYQAYFGELEMADPIRRQALVIPGHMDVQDLMRHFQVKEETLKKLNPALRSSVFNGQKYVPRGYRLYLPESNPNVVLSQIPSHLLKNTQKHSRFYRVQRGDTAGKIARRYGVDLNNLIQANKLDTRATIYVGQNLRIPVKGEKILIAYKVKAKPKSKIKPIVPKPTQPPKEKIILASTAPLNTLFYVRALKSAEVEKSSNIPDPIVEAKIKKRPLEKPVEPMKKSDQVNLAVVMGNLSVEKVFYRRGKTIGLIRVEAEETLGHYADWLQIPTQHIRDINGFPYGNYIHIGQKVEIPFGKITQEQFEEKRYEYHKEIEEDFLAVYSVQKCRIYRIERGDNIWDLCWKEFDLPFWLLKKYNADMDFRQLVPSEKLFVPVVVKIGEDSVDSG